MGQARLDCEVQEWVGGVEVGLDIGGWDGKSRGDLVELNVF